MSQNVPNIKYFEKISPSSILAKNAFQSREICQTIEHKYKLSKQWNHANSPPLEVRGQQWEVHQSGIRCPRR